MDDRANKGQGSAAGRVALVTGGARRLGRAVALALAERGYRLVVHARQSIAQAEELAAQMRAQGRQAVAAAADLRSEDEVDRLVDLACSTFGRIDALANCAAVWRPQALEHVAAADVREHWESNTLAVFLCCRRVGLVMTGQDSGGAIVNFGDWAVVRPYLDYAAYFASKGSIAAMTRDFAVELAARNPRVRVNAILPGPVLLPDDMPAAERAAIVRATLSRREGRAEEVAQAAVFLLENEFVTGVSLPVDGGRSIFAGSFGRTET